jgi:hypothetical protein
VAAVPNQHRSQAFGIVSAGLNAGQGTAIFAAGALTELIPPATVVAAYGLAGTLAAIALATSGHARRAQPAGRTPHNQPGRDDRHG